MAPDVSTDGRARPPPGGDPSNAAASSDVPEVVEVSFRELYRLWDDQPPTLAWGVPFVLPPWLEAWCQAFAGEDEICLLLARRGGTPLGLAPLRIAEGVARFLGSADVCDYQDLVWTRGEEHSVAHAFLDALARRGVRTLDLQPLRPDSYVLSFLAPVAQRSGRPVTRGPDGVSVSLDLPASWESYLEQLDKKPRHEIRRKLRRLNERGLVRYRRTTGGPELERDVDTFLALFRASRPDKASFLTERMEGFFRGLIRRMAGVGFLNLGVLELEGTPVATVLCFDVGTTTYLYNNGYDPRFAELSVGLLGKALSIRDSVERGMTRYDLLRGSETYKYRLGGREEALSHCRIDLSGRPEETTVGHCKKLSRQGFASRRGPSGGTAER